LNFGSPIWTNAALYSLSRFSLAPKSSDQDRVRHDHHCGRVPAYLGIAGVEGRLLNAVSIRLYRVVAGVVGRCDRGDARRFVLHFCRAANRLRSE
jgi:hypothetical protein